MVFNPDRFALVILPALGASKLSAIVAACGVTKSTPSSWRTGKTTPHVVGLAGDRRTGGTS
jgi:hypothetical protein